MKKTSKQRVKKEKVQGVNLGQLQSNYESAKKAFKVAGRNLERANDAYEVCDKVLMGAEQALKNGLRTAMSAE